MVNLLSQAYNDYTQSYGISATTMIIAGLLFFLGYFICIVIVVGIAEKRRVDVFLLSVLCTPIAGLLYIIVCNMDKTHTLSNNYENSFPVKEEEQEDWENALDETLGVKNEI